MKRDVILIKLHAEGKTYREMGEAIGVSRQRAHQLMQTELGNLAGTGQVERRKSAKSRPSKGRPETH